VSEPAPFAEAFDVVRGLRHGWNAFKRSWPVLFVGGCLKNCTEGGGGANLRLPGDFRVDDSPLKDFDANREFEAVDAMIQAMGMGLLVVVAAVAVLVGAAIFLLRVWMLPGWIRVHREILETGRTDWSTLFSGGDRFLAMAGWTLLSGLIRLGSFGLCLAPSLALAFALDFQLQGVVLAVLLGLVAMLVPLLYVGPGLAFGAHALVLEDLPVMDALGRSWELAAGNRVGILVYAFLMGLMRLALAIVGMCALCVGGFITNPFSVALKDYAFTEAYLVFTRGWAAREGWQGWAQLEGK
jgi:hypothetical protein